MKTEKIVCAAVEIRVYNDVVEMCSTVVVPCVTHDDGDPDVTIDKLNPLVSELWTLGKLEVLRKGFVTSKNRFVDAKEAMGIAVSSNQVLCMQEKQRKIIDDAQDGINCTHEIIDHQKLVLDLLSRELKPEDLY